MTTQYIIDKAIKYTIAIIAGAVIMFLLMRSCAPEPAYAETPTVKGTAHDTQPTVYTPITTKPNETIKYKTILQQLIVRDSVLNPGDTVYVYAPIDTLRTFNFNKPFEDEFVKINAKGIITGRLEGMVLDYELKPQKIAVPRSKRFGLGVSVGYGIDGKPYGGVGLNYNVIPLF